MEPPVVVGLELDLEIAGEAVEEHEVRPGLVQDGVGDRDVAALRVADEGRALTAAKFGACLRFPTGARSSVCSGSCGRTSGRSPSRSCSRFCPQAAQFASAFLTGAGLAHAVNGNDRHALKLIVLAVLVVGLARSLFMIGRRLISGRQALGVEFDMRSALYARMLRLSFGFYDRHQTGQLMSRATVDLQTVRFFLGYGLIFFFQNALTLVGAAVVMFVVNWKLTLVALWIAPLLIGLAYRYSHVSHPLLRDVQQKMADVATVAEENIVGVHVVKSFAQERAEQAKFERASESVFRQSVAANRQRAVYVPLLSFLPLLAQAAVLLVGGRMVIDGTLSYQSFFSFNILVLMLVMPLRMLGMWIGQAQRATASGERIFEIIDEPDEVADRPARSRAAAGARPRRLPRRALRVRARADRPARHRPRARAGHRRRR